MNHVFPRSHGLILHRKAFAAGFSLVEVALSLGIVAFCLVSLIGLLPVGLQTVRASRQEAAAQLAAGQIAGAIRNAAPVSNPAGTYQVVGRYANDLPPWTLAGTAVTTKGTTSAPTTSSDITFAGYPLQGSANAASTTERSLAAYVRITPPVSLAAVGTAYITVAWPATAVWDDAHNVWKNAEGSVTSWITFYPN